MKLFITAMISLSFVLGVGMVGLALFFGKLALATANETPWTKVQGFYWAPLLRRFTPLRSRHHSSPGLKAWGFLEVL